MSVLLLAEVTNGELAMDATSKAVTAAAKLGEVTVLCAGASARAAADEAATIDGVARVLCAEGDSLGHRLAEATAELIVGLAGDYSHICAPATTDAKNIMPRVAALLDVMVISDASGVVDADTFGASDLRGQRRPDGEIHRCEESRDLPDLDLRGGRDGQLRTGRDGGCHPRPRTCPRGSRTRSRPPTGPN